MALAAGGPTMTAIELDRDLVAHLAPRLPAHVRSSRATSWRCALDEAVRELLARRAERAGPLPPDVPAQVRIAGNLPYNISTPLIVRLVTLARDTGLVSDATVMVQREVADRLAGRPGTGDYGPLGILAQTWADVSDRPWCSLPGAFRPPPKVDSAVVTLRFRPATHADCGRPDLRAARAVGVPPAPQDPQQRAPELCECPGHDVRGRVGARGPRRATASADAGARGVRAAGATVVGAGVTPIPCYSLAGSATPSSQAHPDACRGQGPVQCRSLGPCAPGPSQARRHERPTCSRGSRSRGSACRRAGADSPR